MREELQVGERHYSSLQTRISVDKPKEGEESRKVFNFVISTGDKDRHNSRINPDGLDVSHFLRNPVVLFNHNYDRVIGTALSVEVKGGKVMAKMSFDSDDPFAAEIERKVENQIIRATSIGFIIKKWSFDEDEDTFVIEEAELVEFSIVTVPSNREALIMENGGSAVQMLTRTIESLRQEIAAMRQPRESVVNAATTPVDEMFLPQDARTADEVAANAAESDIQEPEQATEDSERSQEQDEPTPLVAELSLEEPASEGESSSKEVQPAQPTTRQATAVDYLRIVEGMLPQIRKTVRRQLGRE
jgi:HK97 family phage prohead protease